MEEWAEVPCSISPWHFLPVPFRVGKKKAKGMEVFLGDAFDPVFAMFF